VWENLWKLREVWGNGPIVLKGVQSVEDARLAVEWGLDGVIVSNVSGARVVRLYATELMSCSMVVDRLMVRSALSMRFLPLLRQ
jgi:isopentenyl diphosphate isomerase/L-lactate dehydrogenase-like FMN-dependent dehydrogenase